MSWVGRRVAVLDAAMGGLALDVTLYALSAVFARLTARNVTLPPHGAWGRIAVYGYAAAAVLALGQVAARHRWPVLASTRTRALLTTVAFAATALVPLIVEAAQRAGGRTDRAQDEVLVVEVAGARMWHAGSPYLSHGTIMALPPADRLDAYFPYQPGMALFGLPRAVFGVHWWTDARVWFALALIATVGAAVTLLRRPAGLRTQGAGGRGAATATSLADPGPARRDELLLRGVQAATVFPICALTLATGGDDMVVLGFCLLGFALAASERAGSRLGAAGVAVGLAGAMKLFAWPVALVLLALAATRGARMAGRYVLGAVGLPVVSLIPALITDHEAVMENVVRFPLGRTPVVSPAASPLPGHLITEDVPDGRTIAAVLLLLAGAAVAAWLVRRTPRDASEAAVISASGLLAAILLIPATRFGYLLYPVAYAVWAPALRRGPRVEPTGEVEHSMAYGESPASG